MSDSRGTLEYTMGKKVTRLFNQFQPENYDLLLDPDRSAMTFTGKVTVKGKKVGRPSQRLTFHQKDLKITKATIIKHDKKGDTRLKVARVNNQNSFDEVRLHTEGMLYPGTYTVVLEFSGVITRPMNGIYPCFFTHNGKDKQLIATQFESHHAREAFPCIDEPEAKATFDLTLIVPKGETVGGNTPIKEQKAVSSDKLGAKDPGLAIIFETTPRMSTYLLAFVYGEMGYTEATTKDGVLVRVYATPDNVAYTKFSLEVAVKTLEFYNEYFDIPYPLAKCDLLAIPDYASGAMENWGCLIFREQALLVDPKNTSLGLKQYVANVVAHEVSHQWFGDLVTMRWWTDLWLNESFASWMSYLAVDKLFPEWKVWTQFIVEEQGVALRQDALEHTHPIEVAINHPDEIRTVFDVISYEKGASILFMLHEHLGPEVFRDGIRLYLKRHAYGNTDTVDLWAALEEVAQQPVKEFMGTWTSQSGYPIVRANLGTDRPSLTQERLYLNPAASKESVIWPIPLLPTRSINLETLTTAEQSIDPKALLKDVLLNHDRTGFFRTLYDSKHLEKLAANVRAGKINELDRLGLLSDSFEAAKAGYGSTVDALKLLEAYEDETSAVVWDIITAGIGAIRVVMDDDSIRDGLKPFLRRLVNKQLQRLGWEEQANDSHFDRLLRPSILGLASYGEEPTVVAEAKKRFLAMQQPDEIHPDIRGVVYGTMSRIGGKAEFDKLLAMHNASSNSEERLVLTGALTNFRQPELIDQALAEITSQNVRLQDVIYWVAYSFMNRHARRAAWQWMTGHWDWLSENLGTDLGFYRMPLYSGRAFSDESFLPEFTKFFSEHMSPAFDRPVKQAIEIIQYQSAWKARDLSALKAYFK